MTFPTIEANGDFRELNETLSNGTPRKYAIKRVAQEINFDAPIEECATCKFYKGFEFVYKLADGKRSAELFVYVDDNYLKDIQYPLRELKIKRLIEENAAWFYSYATRGVWL